MCVYKRTKIMSSDDCKECDNESSSSECYTYSCKEINEKYRDAVVNVTSELILTSERGNVAENDIFIESSTGSNVNVNYTISYTYPSFQINISSIDTFDGLLAPYSTPGFNAVLLTSPPAITPTGNGTYSYTVNIETEFKVAPLTGNHFIEYTFNYNITEYFMLEGEVTFTANLVSVTYLNPSFQFEGNIVTTTTIKTIGTFIECGLILVSSIAVIADPKLFVENGKTLYRFPLVLSDSIRPMGEYPTTLIQMSRILVTVNNVNGCGENIICDAEIVMVDGSGGYSLIKINHNSEWNRCLPCIKKHPYLCFGKSRDINPCDTLYMLGNVTKDNTKGHRSIITCEVANARVTDHGNMIPELISINSLKFGAIGLPMINKYGQLVGMFTGSVYGVGISEYFMRGGIKAVINSNSKHLAYVNDPLIGSGGYHRYLKAFAGIGVRVSCPSDLVTYSVQTSTKRPPLYEGTPTNIRMANLPRSDKTISGYLVTRLDDSLIVSRPENSPSFGIPIEGINVNFDNSNFVQSGFIGRVKQDDIITQIDDYATGDNDGSIPIGLRLRNFVPGDFIKLSIYTSENEDNGGIRFVKEGHMERCKEIIGICGDTPSYYDYFHDDSIVI
jgi:hypothetical protein